MEKNIIKNINEIFTAKIRLGAMALLAMEKMMDFMTLKNRLEVSDGNLGAHLRVLENAGYVKVDKQFIDRRPKTTYTVTNKGLKAFNQHLQELESIINKVK
ncbi:MAG: transcriptional regulator [Desulfobacteraceae bacterium]